MLIYVKWKLFPFSENLRKQSGVCGFSTQCQNPVEKMSTCVVVFPVTQPVDISLLLASSIFIH